MILRAHVAPRIRYTCGAYRVVLNRSTSVYDRTTFLLLVNGEYVAFLLRTPPLSDLISAESLTRSEYVGLQAALCAIIRRERKSLSQPTLPRARMDVVECICVVAIVVSAEVRGKNRACTIEPHTTKPRSREVAVRDGKKSRAHI